MNKEIDYRSITRDLLIKESRFPLSIVPTEQDLFYRMALDMYDEIAASNKLGKKNRVYCACRACRPVQETCNAG